MPTYSGIPVGVLGDILGALTPLTIDEDFQLCNNEIIIKRLEGWKAVEHGSKFEWSKSMLRFDLLRELMLTNQRIVFLKDGVAESEIPLKDIAGATVERTGISTPYVRINLRNGNAASIALVNPTPTILPFSRLFQWNKLAKVWTHTINEVLSSQATSEQNQVVQAEPKVQRNSVVTEGDTVSSQDMMYEEEAGHDWSIRPSILLALVLVLVLVGIATNSVVIGVSVTLVVVLFVVLGAYKILKQQVDVDASRASQVQELEPAAGPQEAEPISQHSTMFCRACGAKIPIDSKFCKECGASLEVSKERRQPSLDDWESKYLKPKENGNTFGIRPSMLVALFLVIILAGAVAWYNATPKTTTFVIQIQSNTSWQGAIGNQGAQRSVQGSGNGNFQLQGTIVSASIQKTAESGWLTVSIIRNGVVVTSQTTTAAYGVVTVTASS